LNLNGGTTYLVSFALSSTPGFNPGIVQVTFGTAIQSFTNTATTSYANMQWMTNTLSFTPATTGSYLLQFYHSIPMACFQNARCFQSRPFISTGLQPGVESPRANQPF
jgi:hypothetical protein